MLRISLNCNGRLNLVNAPNQSSPTPRSRLYFVASLLATALGYRNAATDMEDLKCAYEIAREEQIRRNKEFLKSLNLVNPIEKKPSRTPGTKEKKNVHEKHDHDDSKKRKTTRRLGGGEKELLDRVYVCLEKIQMEKLRSWTKKLSCNKK